jgi:3-hydroxyisobutyrate dehydrogenase-like beta-hydroxyacid dehydrogenase
MTRQTVGMVGLGLLGSAVAARLLQSGWSVVGYDVHADRAVALADLGGTALNDASDVFAACEITFVALPDSDVTGAVLEAAASLSPGAVIMDLTTGDPDRMAQFGAQLAERGIGYVDASVGGSSEQVRAGDAIVMAGGEKTVLDRQSAVLASFAWEVFHVGPWGSGARMKLAMNLVLGLNRAVLAEGLAFADACGLSMDDALRVFRAGPAWSRVMDVKGRRMIERDFEPAARLSQHRKDVDLILAAATRNKARTPLSRLHRDLLAEVERAGFGGEDNSAIIRAFETTR